MALVSISAVLPASAGAQPGAAAPGLQSGGAAQGAMPGIYGTPRTWSTAPGPAAVIVPPAGVQSIAPNVVLGWGGQAPSTGRPPPGPFPGYVPLPPGFGWVPGTVLPPGYAFPPGYVPPPGYGLPPGHALPPGYGPQYGHVLPPGQVAPPAMGAGPPAGALHRWSTP